MRNAFSFTNHIKVIEIWRVFPSKYNIIKSFMDYSICLGQCWLCQWHWMNVNRKQSWIEWIEQSVTLILWTFDSTDYWLKCIWQVCSRRFFWTIYQIQSYTHIFCVRRMFYASATSSTIYTVPPSFCRFNINIMNVFWFLLKQKAIETL